MRSDWPKSRGAATTPNPPAPAAMSRLKTSENCSYVAVIAWYGNRETTRSRSCSRSPAGDDAVETAGNKECIGVQEKQEVADGPLGALMTRPRLASPSCGRLRRSQNARAKTLRN